MNSNVVITQLRQSYQTEGGYNCLTISLIVKNDISALNSYTSLGIQ